MFLRYESWIRSQIPCFPQESKNSTLQSIIGKHEDTIAKLHSHVMDVSTKLNVAERSLVKAEMEIRHLKSVEHRLIRLFHPLNSLVVD
jgi:hypothetical protein